MSYELMTNGGDKTKAFIIFRTPHKVGTVLRGASGDLARSGRLLPRTSNTSAPEQYSQLCVSLPPWFVLLL